MDVTTSLALGINQWMQDRGNVFRCQVPRWACKPGIPNKVEYMIEVMVLVYITADGHEVYKKVGEVRCYK